MSHIVRFTVIFAVILYSLVEEGGGPSSHSWLHIPIKIYLLLLFIIKPPRGLDRPPARPLFHRWHFTIPLCPASSWNHEAPRRQISGARTPSHQMNSALAAMYFPSADPASLVIYTVHLMLDKKIRLWQYQITAALVTWAGKTWQGTTGGYSRVTNTHSRNCPRSWVGPR